MTRKDDFGKIVGDLRERLNITQERLAFEIKVSTPTINRWERGKTVPDGLAVHAMLRFIKRLGEDFHEFQDRLLACNPRQDVRLEEEMDRKETYVSRNGQLVRLVAHKMGIFQDEMDLLIQTPIEIFEKINQTDNALSAELMKLIEALGEIDDIDSFVHLRLENEDVNLRYQRRLELVIKRQKYRKRLQEIMDKKYHV